MILVILLKIQNKNDFEENDDINFSKLELTKKIHDNKEYEVRSVCNTVKCCSTEFFGAC